MKKSAVALKLNIDSVELTLNELGSKLDAAYDKSNAECSNSYMKLLDILPEKLCLICMDTNLNNPSASSTKLGCPCQISICTPCFSIMLTEIHKRPLSAKENSFLCFSCKGPVPALKLAHSSFVNSISQSSLLLNAHLEILKKEMVTNDSNTAMALQQEINRDEEEDREFMEEQRVQGYYFSLPPLPESESSNADEDDEENSEENGEEGAADYNARALLEIELDAAAVAENATPRSIDSYSTSSTESLTLDEMLDQLNEADN